MESEAPAIVSVDSDGRLVAHGPGQARVRAKGTGSVLNVKVVVASLAQNDASYSDTNSPGAAAFGRPRLRPTGLVVRPAKAKAHPGEMLTFQALSTDGPVEGAWSSSSERAVAHLQDFLFQAIEMGTSTVCVRVAESRACAQVEVTP